jgi:hypothetical protein
MEGLARDADTAGMGRAGGSAQREYERRRRRDAKRRRANRKLWLAVTLAAPVLTYAGVRWGLPWALDALMHSIADWAGTEGPQDTVLDASMAHRLGLVLAACSTIRVAMELWGPRRSTEAWGKGARGEVATARLLDRLPDGYEVRHDLRMPGSRANIDHVVVGPTGVFTVETKSYQGGVRIAGSRVTSGGRRRDGIVEQAAGQAAAISERIGLPVAPIVVVHGGVEVGWFSSPVVGGVRFCSPQRLVKVLKRGATALSPATFAAALAGLDGGSVPNSAPGTVAREKQREGCSCGGRWVERQRRSDGARFLGCSRFPACRATRNL